MGWGRQRRDMLKRRKKKKKRKKRKKKRNLRRMVEQQSMTKSIRCSLTKGRRMEPLIRQGAQRSRSPTEPLGSDGEMAVIPRVVAESDTWSRRTRRALRIPCPKLLTLHAEHPSKMEARRAGSHRQMEAPAGLEGVLRREVERGKARSLLRQNVEAAMLEPGKKAAWMPSWTSSIAAEVAGHESKSSCVF